MADLKHRRRPLLAVFLNESIKQAARWIHAVCFSQGRIGFDQCTTVGAGGTDVSGHFIVPVGHRPFLLGIAPATVPF
jgi:hypothetical protein